MDILKLISKNELNVNQIAENLNLRQPKVSMMLSELRDLKLINVKIDGRMRIYSINRPIFDQYLDEIKKILSDFEVKESNEIIVRRKVLFSN